MGKTICTPTTALLIGFFALMIGKTAMAGPIPMPLEAQLDLSERVVIGKLTQIDNSIPQKDSQIRWGKATVAVQEVLKGEKTGEITFLATTGVGPDYGGSWAVPVYKVGVSGIWLIMPDGTVNERLDEKQKVDVVRKLKFLETRTWSMEVSGLKAWAGVVQPEYSNNPVIIFAVQNVSKEDIYYPVAHARGVITATAESTDKTILNYVAYPGRPDKKVSCRKLAPGEIVYLHPHYSCIDLAWQGKFPPGEYLVTVTYRNDLDGEKTVSPAENSPVQIWKGELKAPPVKLTLPEKKKS
jgi:hypothetical protein